MSGLLLYSTNVFLKFLIQKRYRSDVHYVWCSEYFNSKTAPKYSLGSQVPASSNPFDIYYELKRDVDNCDMHSAKINAQKASFKSLAIQWELNGEISSLDKADIITMVDTAAFNHWRPLIYLIPRSKVRKKLKLVPPSSRAGLGEEFIIEELKSDEFDLIEF